MERCDFGAAAAAATGLLLRQRLYSLRFDITRLRFDRPVYFDTMQHYCAVTNAIMAELNRSGLARDGLTIKKPVDGKTIHVVLYNRDAENLRRRNFTIAHEIGHIYLNHESDGDIQEREANHFAAQLLLPRILVESLRRTWDGPLVAEDVCAVFGVSRQAARNRLRSLERPIRYTEDDHALLKKFVRLLPYTEGPLITI